MDREKIQKQQSLKLIISETIMVLAVFVTVIVLAFLVSGYWLNADFEVERQGMLQVNSIPTGANVLIDGESSWLQRTNTSKVLPSGEHTVHLTKDGYDSWSKTIDISEGLLYKLHYPRLFLKKREVEKLYNINDLKTATISPDKNNLLLIKATGDWEIINLENEKIQAKELKVADYFAAPSPDGNSATNTNTSAGNIISLDWSKDNKHVLVCAENENGRQWVILNVENPVNSVNLTREFGVNFDKIAMLNDNASDLLIVQAGNLRKIDVQAKQISSILAENVISFDHDTNEVVLVSKKDDAKYAINFLKINSGEMITLGTIDVPAKIVISKFYDTKYVTVLTEKTVKLYRLEDFVPRAEFAMNFKPSSMKVGHEGEFIIMRDNTNIATLDMEAMDVREWLLPSTDFGWLDNDMFFAISENQLFVYDFDGLNERKLVDKVSSQMPVAITDDKWLYYFYDNYLTREWLVTR